MLYYIFILHQTTTIIRPPLRRMRLYYIFILHQTTTYWHGKFMRTELYYIFILHQTTTRDRARNRIHSCIISSFYIKPQRHVFSHAVKCVVLYLHSTSNHNNTLKEVLNVFCCIISSFYIKPQHRRNGLLRPTVVLYLHSTSNHNWVRINYEAIKLYYIFILHQTTTFIFDICLSTELYYIFILHQTTTGD